MSASVPSETCQTRAVSSRLPVASVRPSGLNAIAWIDWLWPRSCLSRCPSVDQMRATPSSPAAATRLPSGLNAIAWSACLAPESVVALDEPTCQTRAEPSPYAAATSLPSALNAMSLACPPLSADGLKLPLPSECHSRAPSSDAVATTPGSLGSKIALLTT